MLKDSRSDEEVRIDARQTAARRFGFLLGCVAAVIAGGIQLFLIRHMISAESLLTVAVMAGLNIPLGILFALVIERMSRNHVDE